MNLDILQTLNRRVQISRMFRKHCFHYVTKFTLFTIFPLTFKSFPVLYASLINYKSMCPSMLTHYSNISIITYVMHDIFLNIHAIRFTIM